MPSKSSASEDRLIHQLETRIRNNTLTEEQVAKFQLKVDKLDKRAEKSALSRQKLFELQALIYAASGKDEDSDKCIVEALTLAGSIDQLSSPLIRNYVTQRISESVDTTNNAAGTSTQRWYRKPLGLLASLAGLVVVFGLINLVFVGGQEALHHGDQSRLDTLKTELTTEKAQLESLSATITSEESYLTTTGKQMDTYKANGQISAYNSLVDPYNSTYDAYVANINQYNASLPSYNAKAEEANKLAKNIGSTYYIVPLPTSKRSH